jgi:hypothetical protein
MNLTLYRSSTRSLVSRDIESCPPWPKFFPAPLPVALQPPSLILSPLPPCSTRLVRCRLPRATILSSSTIAGSPTHLTMPLPMHIVWNPDVHEFARSKVRFLFPSIICFIFIQSSFSVITDIRRPSGRSPRVEVLLLPCSWVLNGSRRRQPASIVSTVRRLSSVLLPSINLTGYFSPQSQCAQCMRPYRSPSQRQFDIVHRHPPRPRLTTWSSSALAAPVLLRCESASRRGCGSELGLCSHLASIVRALYLRVA